MNKSKKRILVVDDDPALRIALKAFLEFRGYEVLQASDGREAIGSAAREKPDLLLMDINMPRFDGLRALEFLRFIGNSIPIIIISSMSDRKNVLGAAGLSADDFVRKPFDLSELGRRVEAQFLDLETSDIEIILGSLANPIPHFLKDVKDQLVPGWTIHSCAFRNTILCVLINPKANAYQPKDLDPSTYETDVIVIGRFANRWRRVWPRFMAIQPTGQKAQK
jgi:CheY-like chemotaxis protein